MLKRFMIAACAASAFALPALAEDTPEPPTPASIVKAAPESEWKDIAPDDLLVMTLAPDAKGNPREVVIQLMPAPFSQGWVENIRTLAKAHWWDGLSVYRSVDNWVVQWGGGEGEEFDPPALPEGLNVVPESEYVVNTDSDAAKLIAGILQDDIKSLFDGREAWRRGEGDLPRTGNYADLESFYKGWPFAASEQQPTAWPTHCYGSVGVARDLSPDTGTGAELYAVIGHAPRQLDRNIAVVGRVIEGMQYLSTLPRGTGDFGVYETREEDTPIVSVRLGSDTGKIPGPRFQYLDTNSESFARYAQVSANRNDAFYKVPAGGIDICNLKVPVRRVPAE